MKKITYMLSLLLLLGILASCPGTALAANAEEIETTVAATGLPSTKAASSSMIVGDWLFTDTIVNRGTNGAAKIMKEYAAAGVTDVYLLCKGIAGRVAWASSVPGATRSNSSRDFLKEACDAAKPYGIRVHAWMMATRDTNYINNNGAGCAFHHFRVGTSNAVNQFISLRDSGYRSYMTKLVQELVANYDIAGIHLDTIRYGGMYYDWGLDARTELINNYGITKAEYNAATKAMCVDAGYSYSVNADGYYIYGSGYSASGVGFASALAGNGSTDAYNGARKFAQFRKDTITDFVKLVKSAAGDNMIVTCAIMPETCTSNYESALYGQSPADLGKVVDYVAVMSYSCEYNAATTWPVTLTTACAKVGCNAIAGIQTYPSEGSSDPDPNGQTVYEETYNIRKAMATNNGIKGYAFFRGSYLDLAGAKVVDSTTVDITVTPGDDAANATKYVFTLQNGMTCSAISNKTGWASGTSFTVSSDKKTITISNGGSTILSKHGTAGFRMTVSGTVNETTGIAKLRSYRGSSYSEGYGYCGTIANTHKHSYTATTTTAATCSAAGVMTYKCSCGHTYTEPIEKKAHTYTSSTADNGITTYTCSVCKYSYSSACGDRHARVETWMRENNKHFSICYDCKQTVTEDCVFEIQERVHPTDTADGYITYVCVGSGSLSRYVSHDNFSGKGCGRTLTVKLPKGSDYTYTNNHNGSHTRKGSASSMNETNLQHIFTNGKCICGEPERSFINLQFSAESVANTLGYWNLNSLRVHMDNAGSRVVGVAYGKDPYMQMLPKGESLHYKIKEGDMIELRLKTNLISGTSDQIQLFYTTTADKTYTESKSVKSAQVLSANGGYKVIRFKMSRNIGEIINALRLDPYSNCSDNFKAEFELDYIYVGSPDQAPSAYTDSIFIDFNNDDRAVGRYMASDIYSSLNYDAKFWYYNAGRSAKPAISNSAGTMTLTIASTTDNYGSTGHSPYFQTTDVSMVGDTVPLNYVPTTKDVVQMRVKFEDCALISGGKARIRLYYIKNDDDGTQGIDTTDYITLVVDEGALSSGKWLTYTTNVGTAFSSAQVINGIRPTFNGICSAAGKTGKITVDYVYVGPINGRPEQDSLMFDFNGSSADLLRYNSKTYGGYNYDDPSNVHWCVGGGSAAVDNKAGTLTLIPNASCASIYAYASRNSASVTAPLSYDLTKADTFQIRLKLENVKTVSGKDPLVALDLFAGGTKINLPDYTFAAAQVTSGKYVVATMPIAEEYRSYGVIDKLSVYLGNLELTTDSKVVIDYIYVGQSNNLPAQDHLFFGFTNTSVDTQRYATKTYSKNNYDAGNWAYNTARNSGPVFGSNTMSIRIAETTDNYSATGVSPFVQTSNNTGSLSVNVLNYYPGAEDYLQVRLCMTDCAVASGAAAVRLYYMTEAGGSMAGSVTKNLPDSALNGGEYITVTVPMSEASGYAASEVITAIRLAFPNVRSADGKTGVITLDYIYVGPKSGLPKPTYTVKFVGADGKTLYSEYVAHGETAVYRGATPKKTSDGTNHYSFKGWDKSLTNITANTTFTAQFTATAHSYTYEKVDGTNHKASCSCGYSKTGGHTWNSGAVTTAASCTAAGVKTYTCTACKATKTETIAKTAHTYGYKVSNAPTTSATGTLTGTCSACKGSTLVTLPKLNTTDYSYTVVKTATCGATGTGRYTWKTTAYGSFSFDVTIAKTTAHSYNSGVITKAPTLNAEGVKTYTCAICKGTKTEAVAKLHESLYMGFDNSAAAKTRYNNYTYGFHNFDLASQWRVAGSGTAAADHSAGTMSFRSGGNGNYLVAHASENASAEGSPLYFDPAKAEVFQLRMKLENVGCVTGKTALVTVDLFAGNTKLDLPDLGLYEHQVLGGDYFLVTLPISEEFRSKGIVTNLHVYIGNITATASSKAVVDYIYVGSEEGLPTEAYTVTFKNYDGTVLQTQTVHKGETAVYTAAAPVKAHDSKYHYSFKGWDKALTNITSDTTVTAQFTSTAHSFIGGSCVCGAKENSDPVVDEGLRIYHTLDLASDISLNYAVLSSALSGYDMSTVRIELSKHEYEGNVEIGTQNRTLYPDLVGNYYYFTLDGLLSIHMNDKISAVLYGEKNGVPSCSQTDLYSIADYAYSRLNNDGSDAALKTLCADLLRYGAAAQTFKGYRTNALADAKMTAAHKAYLTDLDTVSFGGTNREYAVLENAPIKWVGKTLDLANKVTVMYVFDASGYTGDIRDLSLRVNYKTYNGESVALTLSDAQSYGANANYYFFKLDQLLAAELRQPVSIAVYKGTERLSSVLQYSADTYGNNKTGTLLTLCKSLFAYSDSALAYFQK